MKFREGKIEDIPELIKIRNSVKENTLSNPNLISFDDYSKYMFNRGKSWVCKINSEIIGFGIVDLHENNVWALFVQPKYEGRGVGKTLHNLMLNWYFEQTHQTLNLSTETFTRAENFYDKLDWQKKGLNKSNEMVFEMNYETWIDKKEI